MLRSLKRALCIIPCMIMAFLLFTGVKAFAIDAKLVGEFESIVIGEENRENTYYFSNSRIWTIHSKSSSAQIFGNGDRLLKYRVKSPDGKITDWSDKIPYVANGDKFTIDLSKLVFKTPVDGDTIKGVSVAEKATYYVQIKYFSTFRPIGIDFGILIDQKKDETIKIVMGDESIPNSIPKLSLNYKSSESKFDVLANFLDENNQETSAGIITSIKYFYSNEALQMDSKDAFNKEHEMSRSKGNCVFTPSARVTTSFDKSSTEYKYVYVMAESGNGNPSNIVSYDLTSNTSDSTNPGRNEDSNDKDKGSGLFSYKAGELILLVLVVVLIVSCALIITQKIVDYKKKLY